MGREGDGGRQPSRVAVEGRERKKPGRSWKLGGCERWGGRDRTGGSQTQWPVWLSGAVIGDTVSGGPRLWLWRPEAPAVLSATWLQVERCLISQHCHYNLHQVAHSSGGLHWTWQIDGCRLEYQPTAAGLGGQPTVWATRKWTTQMLQSL